jgi:hypothetical protein
MENAGRDSFLPLGKYNCHCANFHKTHISRQLFIKEFHTKVHENLTNIAVADIRSQVDRCLHIRHPFLHFISKRTPKIEVLSPKIWFSKTISSRS